MSNLFDTLYSSKNTMVNGSQMSWVGEQGTPAGEVEQADSSALSRLTIQARRLDVVSRHLTDIGAQVTMLALVKEQEQSKMITSAVKAAQRLRDARNLPHGMTKPLRRMCNAVLSIAEHCDPANIALANKHIHAAVGDCQAMLLTNKGRQQEITAGPADPTEQIYDRAREILRRTSGEVQRLESLKTKPMAVARVPIVPILQKGFMSEQRLKRKGVHYENIGGYALLRNQIVLGINLEALRKTGRTSEKALDAAKRLTATVSKAMGTRVSMVTDLGVAHSGGVWYWLAEDKVMDALREAAGGSLAIRSWGFGFQSGT